MPPRANSAPPAPSQEVVEPSTYWLLRVGLLMVVFAEPIVTPSQTSPPTEPEGEFIATLKFAVVLDWSEYMMHISQSHVSFAAIVNLRWSSLCSVLFATVSSADFHTRLCGPISARLSRTPLFQSAAAATAPVTAVMGVV